MKIEAFSKTYENRTVLRFPGGEFEAGKIYALIGPNGSGKSTFAGIVAGVYPSDQGLPVISGMRVGYLPQQPYAFRMSLRRNLLLNGEGTKEQKKERAEKLMDTLSLSSLASKNAVTLSGGETGRMVLARLFMKQYRLVILDEPSAAMDIASTFQAEALIRQYLARTSCTLFLITHSLRQAERLADEILFFKDGCLVERGRPDTLLHHSTNPEVLEFLAF